MVGVTYTPSDWEKVQGILNENGRYVLEVHNRHIVKVEKAVTVDTLPPVEETSPKKTTKK